jgi:hypothetical protein
MTTISLTARLAFNAAATDELMVALVTISHEDWEEPVRLSSDPTQRLSLDPLRYGTVSNGVEYDFVLMQLIMPDDQEDSPRSAALSFENVDADMAAVIRSVKTPAVVDILMVLASAPDAVEGEFRGFKGVRGTFDINQVGLDISLDPITGEPWPAHRMTQGRFPGLYR